MARNRSAVLEPTSASEGAAASNAEGSRAQQANPSRISTMLRQIADIGAESDGSGVSRLGYSLEERRAHELVSGWLADLGLRVWHDDAGNTIAERPGRRTGAPAIGTGSHLDSVPHGGRYDGIVGVVGAVEAMRLLTDAEVSTEHPIRVVVFACEEGARFGEPCVGSKIVTGALAGRDFATMRDARGISLAEAMTTVGIDPGGAARARWDPGEWSAFLELHIEQARVLETDGRGVGLVDVISGSTRLRFVLDGRADHSGGTPMDLRADALAAAAEAVLLAENLAKDARHRGARATVGRMDVYPNSITTIPGRVSFTLDVRDVDSDRQRATTAEIVQRTKELCERRGVTWSVEFLADTSPVVLPMWIRELTGAVCRELGIGARVMTSGAGHDAQVVNAIIPAGMLFVPSKDGLSHVPEEWTSASDIARGVDVLLHSLLKLDAFQASVERSPGDDGTPPQ
jgi:allantoate deiminase